MTRLLTVEGDLEELVRKRLEDLHRVRSQLGWLAQFVLIDDKVQGQVSPLPHSMGLLLLLE